MARNQDEAPDNDDHIGLSDIEIAALEADDDDDIDALKDIAGDDDDTPTIGDDDEDLDDPAAAKAAAADSTKADAADNGTGEEGEPDDDDPADEPEFQSTYRVDPVDNFDGQLEEIAAEKKALRTKLAEGEIDMDAYEDGRDALALREQSLREQNLKAQIANEQNEQNAQNRWKWEQERFFADKSNELYKDKYVTAMLDMAIRDLAQAPENAQRNAAWFLQEADRLVRERVGKPRDAAPVAKDTKPAARKPDLSKIPKTLGDLPSAELPDTGEDEFSHLEKLDGLKLEAAIAKLSPAQVARYLGISDE